jgi:AhpD family alkylhydroperoxidase
VLVLTKPLGTGILSFAAQLGLVSGACMAEAGAWMAALNKDAAELMLEHGANACTDVTGFGLAGHLVAMVRGSGVSVEIDLSAVPVSAMAAECIRNDVVGGAVDRNQAYASSWVVAPEDGDLADLAILYDPQTSGGLLISMPEDQAKRFIAAMETRGHTATCVIGRVLDKASGASEGRVMVTNARMAHFVGSREPIDLSRKPARPAASAAAASCCDALPEAACCDSPPTTGTMPQALNSRPAEEEADMDALSTFREFMKEANKPGLIDGRSKKLMAVALSIAHHCHPCLKIHLQGAVTMGIPKPEIDEAANLAIAFGGCTAMMFYKEVCQELELE